MLRIWEGRHSRYIGGEQNIAYLLAECRLRIGGNAAHAKLRKHQMMPSPVYSLKLLTGCLGYNSCQGHGNGIFTILEEDSTS